MEELEKSSKNISDFGVESISTEKLWVKFSDDFKKELNGGLPVVTVTPSKAGVFMGVSQVDQEGFMVEMDAQNSMITFNWIAMAKVKTQKSSDSGNENGFNTKFEKMIKSAENDTRPIPKVVVVPVTSEEPVTKTSFDPVKYNAEMKEKADQSKPHNPPVMEGDVKPTTGNDLKSKPMPEQTTTPSKFKK